MFNIWLGLVTILCVICVHLAGNLTNTYYDYINGIDGLNSDDTTLVSDTLHQDQILRLSKMFYFFASVLLIVILLLTNNERFVVVILFVGGASLSFLYTGGLSLKYVAMGDVVIFLTFGPIAVLFGYITHPGCEISLKPVFFSLPLNFLTEAILHINNIRDCEQDNKMNIKTLAVILGEKLALKLFWLLLWTPFLCTILMTILIDKSFLLTILSFAQLTIIFKEVMKRKLNNLPQETAKLNLMYGLLYLVAVMYSF